MCWQALRGSGGVLLSLVLVLQLGSLDLIHGSYLGQTPGQRIPPGHLQDSMPQSVRAEDANGCCMAAFFMKWQGRAGQGRAGQGRAGPVAMCKGRDRAGPDVTIHMAWLKINVDKLVIKVTVEHVGWMRIT
ncbi:MAG: hypothetical protein FRX49_13295 [Trebouxia sp. A1-2]|nr:MAG: hypothetical protein FRX49_13295 [Trebouxia sp. A1-2]